MQVAGAVVGGAEVHPTGVPQSSSRLAGWDMVAQSQTQEQAAPHSLAAPLVAPPGSMLAALTAWYVFHPPVRLTAS